MTCDRIMQCEHIISVVPYKVKAEAIYNTFANDVTPDVPATLLKKHADATVYTDPDSAALLTDELIKKYAE
jgi:glucosamine-6-phosphate deaminase